MEDSHYEKVCRCALCRIFGFTPMTANTLMEELGSAAQLFSMDPDGLRELFGPYSRYAGQFTAETLDKAAAELEENAADGCHFITKEESSYPALLKECPDSPVGFFARCREMPEEVFRDRDFLSFVGTRDVSSYGVECCRNLIQALADSGASPVIVSGLAYGADITAHLAALDCGLDTVAVMATGLDRIYPSRHRSHAGRISQTGRSALVTDFMRGTEPLRTNFLRRNRIIAGLGRATTVIESRDRGGSLTTAHLAFSYDREVYAVPGRMGDSRSAGCNILLRSGCAVPVVSEESFVKALGFKARNRERLEKVAEKFYADRGEEAARLATLLDLVRKYRDISLQELKERTGWEFREVSGLASVLENDGWIDVDICQRCNINVKNS